MGDDAGVGIFRSKKVAKKPFRLTSELALFVLLAVVLGGVGWNQTQAEMKLRKEGLTADGTVVRVLKATKGSDEFIIRYSLPSGRKAEGEAAPFLDTDLKVGQSVRIRYFPAHTTRVWTEDRNFGVWLPATLFAGALASLVVGRWRNARRP